MSAPMADTHLPQMSAAQRSRIWCELLIVLFKINEHTQRMAERS